MSSTKLAIFMPLKTYSHWRCPSMDTTSRLKRVEESKNNSIWNQLNTNYKHVPRNDLKINNTRCRLTANLNLLNRTELYSPKTSHFSLKDHKPNFYSKTSIWIICPTKSDLSRISKCFIDLFYPLLGLTLSSHSGIAMETSSLGFKLFVINNTPISFSLTHTCFFKLWLINITSSLK